MGEECLCLASGNKEREKPRAAVVVLARELGWADRLGPEGGTWGRDKERVGCHQGSPSPGLIDAGPSLATILPTVACLEAAAASELGNHCAVPEAPSPQRSGCWAHARASDPGEPGGAGAPAKPGLQLC